MKKGRERGCGLEAAAEAFGVTNTQDEGIHTRVHIWSCHVILIYVIYRCNTGEVSKSPS